MSESADANLLLKKRARRRLVGAVAFAGLAAVVLPMIMDDEPKQQIQDVQIRIPGQDQVPPLPRSARPSVRAERDNAGKPAKASSPVAPVVESPPPKAVERKEEKSVGNATAKKVEKPAAKTSEKAPEKSPEKAVKPAIGEAQRAAAILEGRLSPGTAKEEYVILIGAFANSGNVKILQNKIGELGVKVYTEPLDSPSGKKTRVRAGPFPSRDAAEKALGKMKRIGVNGIVSVRK